ncbi:MAG: riboflavin biosynthesis protein RibD [Bacteroidetes bacterium]|nr:riboflavin biosynthesis protein RibD [Bacteroidota bacterium]
MNRLTDEFFMSRCIQLATLGAGHVAPNPMVGAVLVHEGRIIGEGYHRIYGQAHAEVNCVNSVKDGNRHLIPAATMYVSLEPCAHYGKTPPCANLIVTEKIREVVIGCIDTFSAVAGKGISILQNAGVTVRTGILEAECRALNSRFFTFHEQQRPYIILKWAQCQAGYMGTEDGHPVRISNHYSDRLVHRWRSEEAGILVGSRTAVMDNPRLNNRLWTGKDPLRIVIDPHHRVPNTHHLCDGSQETFFFSGDSQNHRLPEADQLNDGSQETVAFSGDSLPQLMHELHERRVLSVLVEGGAATLNSFIEAGLWDEARIIRGSITLPAGLPAPLLKHAKLTSETPLLGDHIFIYHREQ